MALWRVHVQLEDRPGRLGELATAVGAAGCNILSLHVVGEPADDGSVTDELLVRMPEGGDPARLGAAVAATGIPCTLLVRADAAELADPATTALALARMVAADPGSAPRAITTLLHARLVDPAAPADGGFAHTIRLGSSGPGSSGQGSSGQGSRGQLRLGRAWPFTATELSRAAALLELAAQLAIRAPARPDPADRILLLRDGSEVRIRAAGPSDAPLVAALHARCAPQTRRARFLSPAPLLPAEQLAELVGGDVGGRPRRAVLAVTADGGSAVGVANLDTGPPAGDGPGGSDPDGPPQARVALLVEDAWQGRGLGTALLRRLVDTAAELGLDELAGVARPDDLGVARLLRRVGLRPSAEIVDGVVRLRAALPSPVG